MCGPVLTISRATCAFKTELLLPIIKRDNTNAADYIYKKFFLPLFFIFWKQYVIKVRKMAKIKSRHNQVPHLTHVTNTRKRHIQEIQEVSPFPASDHWAARHRQVNTAKTNTNKKDPQKSTALERSVRLLEDSMTVPS